MVLAGNPLVLGCFCDLLLGRVDYEGTSTAALDSITFKMEAVEQPHNLLTELTIKTCMTVKSDTHNWKTFCPHHSLCLHHSLYL